MLSEFRLVNSGPAGVLININVIKSCCAEEGLRKPFEKDLFVFL
jgi:hypothetical protein